MSDAGAEEQKIAERRERMDRALLAFRAGQAEHRSQMEEQAQTPAKLYHYTTLPGLVGIVTGQEIWASGARYMNDASELSYAADLISKVVQEIFAEVTDEKLREALPSRGDVADPFASGYSSEVFLACFCEDGDLLSQWRGYGGAEVGVSLGLDLRIMALPNRGPARTMLRKVIYREDEQRQLVRDAVNVWLSTVRSLVEDGLGLDELLPYPAIWTLQEALYEYHVCFKHPAFSEEREWRLIKSVATRDEIELLQHRDRESRWRAAGHGQPPRRPHGADNAEGIEILFRPSSFGLIPYVVLPVTGAGPWTGRLPLRRVIQGPTTHPDLSLASLWSFLAMRGYVGPITEIDKSRVPLRQ